MIVLAGCSLDALLLAGEVATHWDRSFVNAVDTPCSKRPMRSYRPLARASCSSASRQNIYFFRGVAIGDWFGPGRYSQMTIAAEPQRLISGKDMVDLMHQFDARILAVNTRPSRVDLADYGQYFDVVMTDPDGILMTVREPAKANSQ